MDEQSHQVPFGIEAPVPVMFWDPLEFVLAVVSLGFGVISGMWMLGVFACSLVLWSAKRLKRGQKQGAMQHLLWAYGLQIDPLLMKSYKPSWLNDFIE